MEEPWEHSLHLLYEAKACQEEVTVHLGYLHGLHQVVLPDDVLHTDLGTLNLKVGKSSFQFKFLLLF